MEQNTKMPWDEPQSSLDEQSIKSDSNVPNKEEVPQKASFLGTEKQVKANEEILTQPNIFPRPDWDNKFEYNPNILFLNQTLAKELIDKWGNEHEICARKIYEVYIANNFYSPSTLSMDKGTFFETLSLGSGIKGRSLTDLPRNKRKGKLFGTKTVAQLRIEQQVLHFKELCLLNGVTILPGFNTQIKIFKEYSHNVYLVGELDMFPLSFMWKDKPFNGIIDLKLTADVFSDFGPFGWGDLSKVDMIQADMYHNLIMDIDFELNDRFNPNNHLRQIFTPMLQEVFNTGEGRFMFWIFGYKFKDEPGEYRFQFKDPERIRTDERTAILKARIDRTITLIRNMRDSEWCVNPKYEFCKDCPVSYVKGGYCNDADIQEKI